MVKQKILAISVAFAVAALSFAVFSTAAGGSSACRPMSRATARLKDANGNVVGRVVVGVHTSCKTEVEVSVVGTTFPGGAEGPLSAGFHGFHVHTSGVCDPNATDTSGNPSPFFTAGAHWNPPGNDHGAHKGDLPPLLAMENGTATLSSVTDRFRARQLFDEDGSAFIVHGGPDNLANIPPTTSTGAERYHSHQYDTFGPDEDTKKTGDSGARFACGVARRVRQ